MNAPLLARIFERLPEAELIVHWHDDKPEDDESVAELPYAIPGTAQDTDRDFPSDWGGYNGIRFRIVGHGEFMVMR